MFDIDALKEMKLLELQEIAQKIDVPKFRSLKKLDLVYQILDVQAANPKQVKESAAAVGKPKRKRISKNESAPDMATPATEVQKEILPKKQITKKEPKPISPVPTESKAEPKKESRPGKVVGKSGESDRPQAKQPPRNQNLPKEQKQHRDQNSQKEQNVQKEQNTQKEHPKPREQNQPRDS